ncbi:MAG: FecR family protein [Kofleriaceae bacterium]
MTEPSRLGPPPVEPLSDIGWARVEKKLWEQLDAAPELVPSRARTRTRTWLAASLVAVAAMAVVAVIVFRGGGDDPTLAFEPPARIVSSDAPSAITFGDAHVTLDPKSAVVMSRDVERPSAVLEYGSAWFAISPRHGRPAFVVLAGDTTIRVVGTRFKVGRSAEIVTVEVERGTVEVQFHETTSTVQAHQRWSTETGLATEVTQAEPPAPPPSPPPPVADPPIADPKPVPKVRPPSPPTPPTPPPPTVDDAAAFKQLAANEVRDPTATITGYLQLARRRGPYAAMALFAAGRLAADRRDPRAQDLLERYLRTHPRGPNADDARELLAHLKGTPR